MTQPTAITPIRRANANIDRYVQDLRGAYAGIRVWDPDFAIDRDPFIYEKMLRDPTIRQCWDNRKRAIAGGEWSIVAARNPTDEDEEAARVVEQAVSELSGGFQKARVNLAKFVWEGARHAMVEGRRWPKPYGDGEAREWWYPTKLRDFSKRRVRVWREGGEIRRKILPILNDEGVDFDQIGVDWPEDRIITAIYDDEEGRLGFGRGLGDSCYWFFFLKWKLIEEGIDAAREWAQGLIVAKVSTAPLGDTGQDTTSTRDALTTAIRDAKRRGIIAIGTEDEIDKFDATGQGAAAMLEWLQMLDDGLRTLISGSLLPTGGGDSGAGSLARGEVEERTSEGVFQLDSDLMDESMTSGLIAPVWERNREHFADLGLGEARMPLYRSVGEKREDFEKNATIIGIALDKGIALKEDEVFEKLGLTPPTDEDRKAGNVIEPPAPEPGGFGDDPFGSPKPKQNGTPPAKGNGDKDKPNRIKTADTPAEFMFAAPPDPLA
jgi:hypothetical protein